MLTIWKKNMAEDNISEKEPVCVILTLFNILINVSYFSLFRTYEVKF